MFFPTIFTWIGKDQTDIEQYGGNEIDVNLEIGNDCFNDSSTVPTVTVQT